MGTWREFVTAQEYIYSRGYSDEFLQKEGLVGVWDDDPYKIGNIEGRHKKGDVIFTIKSMSGRLIGFHHASTLGHDYRTYYDMEHHYIPMVYGDVGGEDYDLMWSSKEVILTEGVFDRIAIKRAFPERAVLARLTKGVSPQLMRLFERVVERVWIAFDMDAPGVKSAERTERKLAVDVVRLEIPYKDPSEFLAKRGLEVLKKHYGKQIQAYC